jgi:hypothetical protein
MLCVQPRQPLCHVIELPKNHAIKVCLTRLCAAGVQRPVVLVHEEDDASVDGCDEPQEHVYQVNVNGALHALDSGVAFGILVQEQLREDAEKRNP